MRRLLHVLIMSFMITGLLFFGATSAFADTADGATKIVSDTVDGVTDGVELPARHEADLVTQLLCIVQDVLGGQDADAPGVPGGLLGTDGIGEGLLDVECDHLPAADTPPQAAPVTPVHPVGSVGDVGAPSQVSGVPRGGVATGGGTAPVGAVAVIGTLLAIAVVGAGLGRALARS